MLKMVWVVVIQIGYVYNAKDQESAVCKYGTLWSTGNRKLQYRYERFVLDMHIS